MRFISYPKTKQYKDVIKEVTGYCIKNGRELPKLTFHGSVKLHGTMANLSFGITPAGMTMSAQSRSRMVTPESDNAGWAFFCESRKEAFEALRDQILKRESDRLWQIYPDGFILSLFGEYFGQGINSGVAINQLGKRFSIFGLKASPLHKPSTEDGDEESKAIWLDYDYLRDPDNLIYNTLDFDTYTVEVDFAAPEIAQNQLVELTELVERECPVGKAFGVSGIGEGIVWSYCNGDHITRFKTKGEKHTSSKVTTIAAVNDEVVKSVREFIEYAVTENRLQQAVTEVVGIGNDASMKDFGAILKWLTSDVIKEEASTMAANGIEPRMISKQLSQKALIWFKGRYAL